MHNMIVSVNKQGNQPNAGRDRKAFSGIHVGKLVSGNLHAGLDF